VLAMAKFWILACTGMIKQQLCAVNVFVFLFLAASAMFPGGLLAQADSVFSFGPHVAYTFGAPQDIERSAVSTLGSNGMGTSYAQTIRAGLEVSIPKIFFRDIGLSLIGTYSWSTGEFTSRAYPSSDNASAAQSTQEFHLSSRYATASLTALLAYHLSDAWDVGVGAELGYRAQDSLTDWREILSPAGVRFANGSTRDTVATGTSISSSPLGVTVPVFLGYRIPLGRGISLAGRFFGTADLNEIVAGYAAQSLSAGISFSLLFAKNAAAPTDIPIVHAPPSQPKPSPSQQPATQRPASAHILAAVHLEINSVAAKTATVREVDTLIETFTATPDGGRIPKAESRLVRSYIVPD